MSRGESHNPGVIHSARVEHPPKENKVSTLKKDSKITLHVAGATHPWMEFATRHDCAQPYEHWHCAKCGRGHQVVEIRKICYVVRCCGGALHLASRTPGLQIACTCWDKMTSEQRGAYVSAHVGHDDTCIVKEYVRIARIGAHS